jgi:predicted Zn finger-like uncharacterized protein
MKFLCPSCKAKYQLADEKVSGRSVRMKCRKCGYMIQISGADAIHESDPPVSGGEIGSLSPEPPTAAPSSVRSIDDDPLPPDDDETTAIVQPRAVARAMAAARQAAAKPQEPAADGWFVGINGVPVGPIRLSELRSKAATGAINLESLTWRETCDEWRPLRTFPELASIVEQVQEEALRAATGEGLTQAAGERAGKPLCRGSCSLQGHVAPRGEHRDKDGIRGRLLGGGVWNL